MGLGFQTPGAWFSKVGSPVFCSSGTILGIRGLAVGWVGLDHLARPPGSPTTLLDHLARPPLGSPTTWLDLQGHCLDNSA